MSPGFDPKKTHVYCAETYAGKKNLLGKDAPPVPDFLAHLVDKSDVGSSAKEKSERDARWIGDFTDELTVAIALRNWDQAVNLVREGMIYLRQGACE